ncbi:hypothetical protein AVI51_07660 [Piscirickettsia salmonis]|uniref:Helix-turn-helix domain protein n=1 Tax=Piscirickettsia salmonis TaxID=1238 RepID=A0A9Q5V7C6_PISSA|nr:hypothetical protein [Piscirickettsia salmonis]ALA25953.1 helix-turn-helix domain protein [Piscirickettsia salmonis]APS43417.1 hypothetical protein AVI48_02875 [Piscirickettsia salmonis]APS46768.1 hypothetical protein AVI49_03480 [Piscirickettsia salmonis]APS50742.1 hypothetical protein AVI50_07745 [Piscirickettsia salmonis]APS53948.1 hypothetical protein AVI51_07660 [Piscirickettsia salmonis]
MRLIAAEDYADWKGVKIQEVYQLIKNGDIRSLNKSNGGLKRLELVYVEQVPEHILSLDSEVEYLNQKQAAKKLNVSVDSLRKRLRENEVKSFTIKGYCFIPMNQFNESVTFIGE